MKLHNHFQELVELEKQMEDIHRKAKAMHKTQHDKHDTSTTQQQRNHTDIEVMSWVDGEGGVDLDTLTVADLEMAERFIRGNVIIRRLLVVKK
tara:strand:+ start:65 stop:343 length:279 start_codon:yes stop_codon:yes gene_type:complete